MNRPLFICGPDFVVDNIFSGSILQLFYRGDSIFWPDINNQIPDIVCALVKIFLG